MNSKKVELEFKAGRMILKDGKLISDTRKGLIQLYKQTISNEDQVYLSWMDRTTGVQDINYLISKGGFFQIIKKRRKIIFF